MKNKKQKNNKGQILVITLLVLLVLSIIVLSTVVNLTRDVRERVNNELYEENYINAEAQILQASEYFDNYYERVGNKSFGAQDLSDLESSLNRIVTEGNATSPDCNVDTTNVYKVTCNVKEGEIITDLTIEQKNYIEDFEMSSNDVLQLNFIRDNGVSYTGPIRWKWTGNAIWSLTLVYEKTYAGQTYYEVVRDVYDQTGRTSRASGGSVFTFRQYSQPGGETITNRAIAAEIAGFTQATINDPKFDEAGTGRLLYFRLRPIISPSGNVTVSLYGDVNLPIQFVEITAQSYQEGIGDETPTPLLSVKRPIVPAPPALFDYVYYTNTGIQ